MQQRKTIYIAPADWLRIVVTLLFSGALVIFLGVFLYDAVTIQGQRNLDADQRGLWSHLARSDRDSWDGHRLLLRQQGQAAIRGLA
jgi:hypothetical protein